MSSVLDCVAQKGGGGDCAKVGTGASEDAEWSQCAEGPAVPLMAPQ